ncbi:MAG: hypothetical protein HY074_18930 [Deltaproteobacteria bacterium]|nr:hypothetical protein [Deltaproteobacteria bacterium]
MRQKPRALTLVLNPNARKPRLKPPSLAQLKKALGPNSRIHVTRNLEELDRLMQTWRNEEETVCFYGGDGSIARGLTSLIWHKGESYQLPPVLAVRAGTINMLCSMLGFREKIDRTLERWNRQELNTLRQIPLLKVEVENKKPQYGFIFSWGIGYRVLREYYARREIPDAIDGLAVLANTFFRACMPNASHIPMFKGFDLKLVIDGKAVPTEPLRSLAMGTISRLSLGLRPFAPEPILPGGFHLAANSMPVGRVALHAPTLLFQIGDQRKLARKMSRELISATGVREVRCELSEGFTMDGEMFEMPARARIKITAGPVVRFWTTSQM